MESAERVRAALALERADRVPAGWWGHTYREEWSPEELAAVTVERRREHGWDFVKLQPRASCFAEAFGSTYRAAERFARAPVLVGPAVRSREDWSRLPAVDSGARPLADQVDALRRVVSELGSSVPVLQTVFSPLTVAGYLLGLDKDRPAVMRELREAPQLVGPALGLVADALGDFATRSVEAGAAGVFYAISGYASDDAMTPQGYRELALAHDRRVLGALPGEAWFNVLHLCGPRVHFDLSRELGVHAVSWSVHEPGNPSLAEGRDRGGRAVMGGLDQRGTLVKSTPEDVIAEATAAVTSTGGGGLLLAPGCSVPPEAPLPNLLAIADAASR